MIPSKQDVSDIIKLTTKNFDLSDLKDDYYEVMIHNNMKNFKEELSDEISNDLKLKFGDKISEIYSEETGWFKIFFNSKEMNEAEYKGRDVKLNKPQRNNDSGGSKYVVYVKDPKTGNVKKVNFGSKDMEIKRDNPKRRKSFRARHNCDNPGPKTKPRYWSCKFWSTKSVTDLLNEVIDPKTIDVNQLKIKDQLNPDIWDDKQKMLPEVRKVLLKNVINFIKYAKLNKYKIKDITLTGSMANYNYTDESDLDVHILMNFDQVSDNKELVSDYFRNKKSLYNENYGVKVKDHDVEMYIQDINEAHNSTGVYSLYYNEWLTKPIKKMISIDTGNVQLKSAEIMNKIDKLEDETSGLDIVDKVDELMNKIKKMRKAGLNDEGEFSTENLVFKILRNTGYLNKLTNIKKEVVKNELTLENVSIYTANIVDKELIGENIDFSSLGKIIRNAKNAGILSLGLIVGLIASGVTANELERVGVDKHQIQQAIRFVKTTASDLYNQINLTGEK